MPRKIKAIIFDCFGVLYPVLSAQVYNLDQIEDGPELFDELNKKIDIGEISSEVFHRRISEKIGIPPEKIIERKNEALILDRELIKLIRQLKQQYKIGLLTNTGDEELDVLDRDGIKSLFDVITASYLVKILKPDSRIYKKCADDLGIAPEECLFIDDNYKNIKGARGVGMKAIHYKNLSQFKNDLGEFYNTSIL